jgi:STE24 endopeptidase
MRTPWLSNLALGLWLLAVVHRFELAAQPANDSPQVTAAATNTAAPPARFDVATATRTYLDRLSPAEKARSDAYFEGGYWLQLWGFLWGAGVAAVFMVTGLSAKLRDTAERFTRRRWLQATLYAAAYIILSAVLGFPLSVYQDFFREHQYNMANQDFAGWFGDQAIALAASVVLGSPFLAALASIVRRLPRTWHWWGAATTLGFFGFVALIAPIWIAPLFNKYTPLDDPKVVTPILSLAHANGIQTDKVWVMDASKQTKRVSANVSGMLGTMRITLNDNLLNRSSLAEIEAVMGHEMGHYVLNHVYKSLVFFALVIIAGFAFLRRGLDATATRAGARWRVNGPDDIALLPVAIFLFSAYLFILTPILNTETRTQEAEADIFGLNASRRPDGFAEAALKLSEYRKMEPGPIEEWMFYDHPSGASRIRMAMQWKAEHLTDPVPPTSGTTPKR